MAWGRPGDKSLSQPMMVSLLTQICVTRPQWVDILAVVYTPAKYEDEFVDLTYTFAKAEMSLKFFLVK